MAGHSKWENIKRQKKKEDRARAKVFGKLSKLITTAVQEGGSDDPEANVQLRQAIERAKEADMPKDNINRAIENATKGLESAEEIFLEAYGPEGIAILIRGFTDNRQRTVQEVKTLIDRHNGSLAEPGAVGYQFNKVGKIIIKNPGEDQLFNLLDIDGILNFEEQSDQVELTVSPEKLTKIVQQLDKDFNVKESQLHWQADNLLQVNKQETKNSLESLISKLEDRIDVKGVFTNWQK
jgi:YebC/PmpR family DNA-binding regulatory protein